MLNINFGVQVGKRKQKIYVLNDKNEMAAFFILFSKRLPKQDDANQ